MAPIGYKSVSGKNIVSLWIHSLQMSNDSYKNLNYKIQRSKVTVLFNQICLKEKMLTNIFINQSLMGLYSEFSFY